MKKRPLCPLLISSALCALLLSCASAPRPAALKAAVEARESDKPAAPEIGAPAPETRSDDKAEKSIEDMELMVEAEPERSAASRPAPEASGLAAGFADDNKQFNYFIGFLARYSGEVPFFPIPVQERIVFKVTDRSGKPMPNAGVTVTGGGKKLAEGAAYADGTFLFFPAEHGEETTRYQAAVSAGTARGEVSFDRGGRRQIDVQLQASRPAFTNVPLDILFILDTTGSMEEEIDRLKATIEIINLNLSSLSSKPAVRFGLVLYRDREDEYVTQVVPLTADLARFQGELAKAEADGGGDDPEDLQSALGDAMKKISWDPRGIRLAFVITDAAPHLDYEDQAYTYVDAARDARRKGIKVFSVGTGGLELDGELVLRQISQYTYAKYIFLTYGEEGESEGGSPGSVSHHTGSNYQTDKLEAIVIRLAREELSYLTDQPIGEEGDFFQAVKIPTEEKSRTLAKLFDMAISQIIDYASIRLPEAVPTGALPLAPESDAGKLDAEYFSEQLVLSLARNGAFAAVERKDLQSVLKELELQMSGITDEANAAKIGKLMGARMLLTGRMFDRAEAYEIFLKLLRVETGEILSVTKLVVDKKLGL